MIIRLSGGLGNQLFQYAFCLANSQGSKFQMDLDRFSLSKAYQNRLPELLKIPGLSPSFICSSPFLIRKCGNLIPTSLARKLLGDKEASIRALTTYLGKEVMVERISLFDEKVEYGPEYYYVGNFTSRQYWRGNDDVVISHIRELVNNFAGQYNTKTSTTINLHVRRGDYIENSKTRAFHGVCSDNYYLDAVNSLLKVNPGIEFAQIYSDSPEYCVHLQNLIHQTGLNVSISNIQDPLESLASLSQSEYFVGSNSTFSWWAGMLGPSRTPVFPQKWFKSTEIEYEVTSAFCKEVILLDSPLE